MKYTLVVKWQDSTGAVKVNALYNAVIGDTLSDDNKMNLNRVYKLLKGGYHRNNKTIKNNFPLKLVWRNSGFYV